MLTLYIASTADKASWQHYTHGKCFTARPSTTTQSHVTGGVQGSLGSNSIYPGADLAFVWHLASRTHPEVLQTAPTVQERFGGCLATGILAIINQEVTMSFQVSVSRRRQTNDAPYIAN
jgi:hypothetical protein